MNKADIIKLLKEGGDINQRNKEGKTALYIATETNNLDLLIFLLKNKADPNIESLQITFSGKLTEGQTALCKAVENNATEAVTTLLQYGAEVNKVGEINLSPLCIAIGSSNLPMVQLLLEHKANPNQILFESTSPFFMAVTIGDIKITKLLLDSNADLTQEIQQQTALDKLYTVNPPLRKMLEKATAEQKALTTQITQRRPSLDLSPKIMLQTHTERLLKAEQEKISGCCLVM
ncbi:MAG: ankyrin repeat domain-containing protein [Alphaproteobacteria bacterium]|jgi:ankyrin repeat protein|nr:ankyrin repeat domain-containing protein [Alphaproteobacteria bacterium]